METRKVQQTGGSTYIISLPKPWAEKIGIGPGSRVGVQPQPNGKLLISPEIDSKPLRRKSIDITALNGSNLERAFIATYLTGYDIIEFVSSKISADQKKILRTVCHKLIGPEIIEENSSSVLIQDLLNPSELSIKKAVQRMFLISNSMFDDSISAVLESDADLAADVMSRDDEVDRLYLVISKQFKAILCGTGFADTTDSSIEEYHNLRMAAAPIERIADHSHKIAYMVILLKPELDQKRMTEIKKLSEFASDAFNKSVDALYNFNPRMANKILENQKVMNEMITQFNRSCFDKTTDLPFDTMIAVRTITDSIGRINDYAANIAEIAINASVDMPNAKW